MIFNNKGITTTYILTFGAIFLVLMGGLLSFVLFQLKATGQQVAWRQAFQTAESGIDYYQWCLNNESLQNCSQQRTLFDLSGAEVGEASIELDTTSYCGSTTARTIVSSGHDVDFPKVEREIQAYYGQPSVAQYAYLINDNVEVNSDQTIRGPYHSNGGIRMDGNNLSLVTSARSEEWSYNGDDCPDQCESIDGNCMCPPVFTTTNNSNPDLFKYGTTVDPFYFESIDWSKAKQAAISTSEDYPDREFYFPPASEGEGYHITLQGDEFKICSELDLFEIDSIWDLIWNIILRMIKGEECDTYRKDPNCPVIFVEDNLWLEGTNQGKTTIIAADNPTDETNVVLMDDVDYSDSTSSNGLTVIAENDIQIDKYFSPSHMTIKGIYIAKNGRFFREKFDWEDSLGWIKDELEIHGSIISNGSVKTRWSSGGHVVSGYRQRTSYIDNDLLYQPPPFTPLVSNQFKIINWRELE